MASFVWADQADTDYFEGRNSVGEVLIDFPGCVLADQSGSNGIEKPRALRVEKIPTDIQERLRLQAGIRLEVKAER